VTTFENWCALNNVPPLPAAPADVAKFITDCAPLGIEKLWPMVQEISRAHYVTGLADPTLGGWPARAINDVSKIEPPRGWPADEKVRFLLMSYDLQLYVLKRDAEREAVVKIAIQVAADARKESGLPKLPKSFYRKAAKAANGTQSNTAA